MSNQTANIEIVTDSNPIIEPVQYQRPDGFSFVRAVLPEFCIPKFLRINNNPTEQFAGRMSYTELTISSLEKLELGEKFDFVSMGKSYNGVMPLEFCGLNEGRFVYNCAVEYTKAVF
jgi:hypothetical protein